MMKQRTGIAGVFYKWGAVLFFMVWSAATHAQVMDITQDELLHRIQANKAGLILDVRTAEEYAEGHIPGSVNIPYDHLNLRKAEIAAHKDKEIVLYCRSGSRVKIAANTLDKMGFKKLLHLAGDMGGWARGNLPIKR
jgi:rhodanese-related sulfurtransferase